MKQGKGFLYLLALLAWFGGLALGQTAPYTRTVIVPGDQSDTVNGQALIDAMNNITTATAADPWLIKLEPGVYDLDSRTLDLKSHIDIEGSGRKTTKIVSDAPYVYTQGVGYGATLRADDVVVELRDLTIENDSSASGAGLVGSGDGLCFLRVNFEVHVPGSAYGFNLYDTIRATDVAVDISGSYLVGGTAYASGVNPNETRVRGLRVKAVSTGGGRALYFSGKGSLDDIEVDFEGNDGYLTGLELTFGLFYLTNSRISIVGNKGASNAVALLNFLCELVVRDSVIESTDQAIENNGYHGTSYMLIEGSAVSGELAIQAFSAETRVGGSRIEGTINIGSFSTIACITCYDGSMSALNSTCQ